MVVICARIKQYNLVVWPDSSLDIAVWVKFKIATYFTRSSKIRIKQKMSTKHFRIVAVLLVNVNHHIALRHQL